MGQLKNLLGFALAPFRFDVTPPLGHPLLGGLVMPAIAHDDPLEGIGFVLLGAGRPIVGCVLDWAGLHHSAHAAWRHALAAAAATTPERVAVHCVHQHNAPFVSPEADIVARAHGLAPMYDETFHADCLERAGAALRTALGHPQPLTHVAHGAAQVPEVASNRRVARDSDSRITAMRKSACEEPELRALPEGTIDPWLQTVAFFSGERKIAACHYYATHPMSYYRDGRVSTDFCGLARRQRERDDPGCTHLYFSGCAGNVAAGKYNTGTPAERALLTRRIHDALVASENNLQPEPLRSVAWQTEAVLPEPRTDWDEPALTAALARTDAPDVDRVIAAFKLGWLARARRREPFVLSRLRLNEVSVLNLPGEMFVEYQLRARALRPGRPVCVAAYGDDGLWYVPTREEYPNGGYEVEHAFAREDVDDLMTAAIRRLLE